VRPLTPHQAADLIEAIAKRQDKKAFAVLFRHYMPRLAAFIAQRGANESMAQEVAQEALMAVWRKAASFDRSRASPTTWIYVIARNKRIDLIRRNTSPPIHPDDWLANFTSEQGDIDQHIETGQAFAQVKKLLNKLPAEQLVVIKKAFFEQKTHTEIAQALAEPLGTIKSRIRLALCSLRSATEKGAK
jgi:RNA polymerase sigma-70 factor (ECF subfamily)